MTKLEITLSICLIFMFAINGALVELAVRELREELVHKTEVIEVQHQVDLYKTQLIDRLANALLRCSAADRPQYFVADKLPPELEIQ